MGEGALGNVEELVRFGTAGYLFLLPVALLISLREPSAWTHESFALLFIVGGPAVGYMIQQAWFACFRYLLGGYASLERRAVSHVQSRTGAPVEQQERVFGLRTVRSSPEALYAWDTEIFRAEHGPQAGRARRGWMHYHASRSMALASLLAVVPALVLAVKGGSGTLASWMGWGLAGFFLILPLPLWRQGKAVWQETNEFEEFLARKWWPPP